MLSRAGDGARLFLASAAALYLELACIRWFPAHVLFLTFFTNTILLASFLGLSLGALAASRPRSYIRTSAPLLAAAMLAAHVVERVRHKLDDVLDVGRQSSAEMVYFGTEKSATDVTRFVVPMELLAAIFFVLVALGMVGLGQEMGRAFVRHPDRVKAYSINVLGSIAGIVAFALCSYGHLRPLVWFALAAAAMLPLLMSSLAAQDRRLPHVLALCLMVALSAKSWGVTRQRTVAQSWSPYYRIDHRPARATITANLVGHQRMVPRRENACAYDLPHLLRRDAGLPPVEDVLIIGAGSGNDVARALAWGAKRVDAVEIDPVIQRIGAKHHPDRPYDDPRVRVILTDGRSWLRRADKTYDLVIYALVDSLVLHSSLSNIRLESYLFTNEALADAKARLRPDGTLALYNYFRQGFIVARLARSLGTLFGRPPLVLTMPRQERVTDGPFDGFTLLLSGDVGKVEAAFARAEAYHLRQDEPPGPASPDGFAPRPAAAGLQSFALASVDPISTRPATDDWPFLYLRRPMVPRLTWRGIILMSVAAAVLLLAFRPFAGAHGRADPRMFFLGAGFMLLETRAVVQLALLFGSTWIVNCVVFVGVLSLILVANLIVLRRPPQRLGLVYAGLFAALFISVLVPLQWLLVLPWVLRAPVASAVALLPIFFAGIVFASAFRKSASPDRDFGINTAGAMAGGLVEPASLLLGFSRLGLVAAVFYLAAAVVPRRSS